MHTPEKIPLSTLKVPLNLSSFCNFVKVVFLRSVYTLVLQDSLHANFYHVGKLGKYQ